MAFNTGKAIDEIAQLQLKCDRLQAALLVAEREVAAKKEKLLKRLKKSALDGARGRVGVASVLEEDVPTMEDFMTVWKWARKNNAPEIFQKRLSSTAVRERWEAGKNVPGVGRFHRVVLRINQTRGRKKGGSSHGN